jgi:hypothetical protein
VEGGNDPLLFAERHMYLKAIQDALAGADAAPVVLSGVVKRLEGGRAGCDPQRSGVWFPAGRRQSPGV